jgi:putative peptidoglycan lipid II flippase
VAATSVGAGILLSRLAGLARAALFAKYFGQQSEEADAFNQAFRIPNLLQNLFGEGALSGSFIPVHAALRARGEHDAAAQAARTVFAILALVMSLLVLLGVIAAPLMVTIIAPGFEGAKRELTIRLVKVLFPGAGLLVASAWCLGVLNSHGRFLLSYTAPVAWNAAMIATLVGFGRRGVNLESLAWYLAWGSVAGSFLQFAVQAPLAWRLSRHPGRLALSEPVRQAARTFVPVMVSRGAVQLSSYIDAMIASWLPTGAVTALTNTQLLYTLPVSLFGVSISAAELPAMSGDAARESGYAALRTRLDAASKRLAFFVVPSAVAFALLGDVIAGTLFERGRFMAVDSEYVWTLLAGASIGLLASTMARLYAVAHYALGDTKRPLRFALVRLTIVAALGYVFAIVMPPRLDIASMYGAAGLTIAGSVAGWVEYLLLRRSLNARIGSTGLPISYGARVWLAAILAGLIAWVPRMLLPPLDPLFRGAIVLPIFGAAFLAVAWLTGVAIPGVRRNVATGR